jgi:hypothetical protein
MRGVMWPCGMIVPMAPALYMRLMGSARAALAGPVREMHGDAWPFRTSADD